MSLSKLQEHILEVAKQEADDVRATLAREYANQEARITAVARKIEETIIDTAQARALQEERRLHQQAELAGRAHVLRAKQDELATTERMTVERLMGLDEKHTKEMLTALISLLPKNGKGVIIPGALHEKLLGSLTKDYKLDTHSLPDQGGFVYRDDSTEINLTITHLVARLFSMHKSEIATALLGS